MRHPDATDRPNFAIPPEPSMRMMWYGVLRDLQDTDLPVTVYLKSGLSFAGTFVALHGEKMATISHERADTTIDIGEIAAVTHVVADEAGPARKSRLP